MQLSITMTEPNDIVEAMQVLAATCRGLGTPCHVVFGPGAERGPDDTEPVAVGETMAVEHEEEVSAEEAPPPAARRKPRRKRRAKPETTEEAAASIGQQGLTAVVEKPPTTEEFAELVRTRGLHHAVAALQAIGQKRWSDCTIEQQVKVLEAMRK